jgi:hypothetical protein
LSFAGWLRGRRIRRLVARTHAEQEHGENAGQESVGRGHSGKVSSSIKADSPSAGQWNRVGCVMRHLL